MSSLDRPARYTRAHREGESIKRMSLVLIAALIAAVCARAQTQAPAPPPSGDRDRVRLFAANSAAETDLEMLLNPVDHPEAERA